jgi:D-alanine-D-alanine ligase
MNGSEYEFLERISSVLGRLEKQKDRIVVFVVCCVKGVTEAKGDYPSQSVTTEFFSSNEVEQILGSLRNFGFYVRPFFSEMDFIRVVDTNKFQIEGRPHLLAYNTAHSGTGPGRKALIPSFCALHGIPITSADAYVVSLARHKFHVARLLTVFGLETPDSWFYTLEEDWLDGQRPPNGLKVILKPTYESASIGITNNSVQVVDAGLDEKVREVVLEYRQPITVQSFVPGWEVEVPVKDAKSMSIRRPRPLGDVRNE